MDHFALTRMENRFGELEAHKTAVEQDLPILKTALDRVESTLGVIEPLESRLTDLQNDLARLADKTGGKDQELHVRVLKLETFQEIQEQKNKDFLWSIGLREQKWTAARLAYLAGWALTGLLYFSSVGATTAWIIGKIGK